MLILDGGWFSLLFLSFLKKYSHPKVLVNSKQQTHKNNNNKDYCTYSIQLHLKRTKKNTLDDCSKKTLYIYIIQLPPTRFLPLKDAQVVNPLQRSFFSFSSCQFWNRDEVDINHSPNKYFTSKEKRGENKKNKNTRMCVCVLGHSSINQ